MISAPLDVSGDQVRAGEPDVGKEALGDVGHHVDVKGLGVLPHHPVQDGLHLGLVDGGVEEVVLQPDQIRGWTMILNMRP